MKTYYISLSVLVFTLTSCDSSDDNLEIETESPIENNVAPENFSLLGPVNEAANVDTVPTLSWEEAMDPDGDEVVYDVYLSQEADPVILVAENITATAFEVLNSLDRETIYFWKVTAKDNNGNEVSTNVQQFKTRGFQQGRKIEPTNLSERWLHTTLVFNDKLWIIGGTDEMRNSDVFYSDDDGQTWVLNEADFPARSGHTSVVFNDRIWVIGGFGNSSNRLSDVWSSSDGVTWTEETESADFAPRNEHTSIIFDNKIWVIGGFGGATSFNDIWSSTDGINWEEENSSANFEARGDHQSVVFDNKIFVVGGYSPESSLSLADVWSSSDGTTWNELTSDGAFLGRRTHSLVVFNDELWVIGGNQAGTIKNDIWVSVDGLNWSLKFNEANFSPTYGHASVVFKNKLYVTCGRTFAAGAVNENTNAIWVID